MLGRCLAVIALAVVAAPAAWAAGQDKGPDAEAAPADPMASFARLVSGEWKTTFPGGTSLFHAWSWGPGRHSIREMTDGVGGGGDPWRELRVMYWHPGRKQVRLLGLSPYDGGVAEGAIAFDGEAASALVDMYQTRGRRRLSFRWKFDGPDRYHDALLEATGPAGYSPLAAWDRVRIAPRPRPAAVGEAPKPSERFQAFRPLLGRTWEARGGWAAGGALHVRSTFEWVPLANAIYVRTLAPAADAEPSHLLDAYVYHHTGTGRLRCLALSARGGVYEGDVAVRDGGALQLDLQGSEGDRVVPYVVRFDSAKGGTLRQRVWSLSGAERTLLLDVHHKPLEPKTESPF